MVEKVTSLYLFLGIITVEKIIFILGSNAEVPLIEFH